MIVGFSLDHMEADKDSAVNGEVNVNYSHTITDIEATDVAAFDDPVAKITFAFGITYGTNDNTLATLDFGGTVLVQDDTDQIIEQWEDDETIDEQVAATVANHVYRKCLTQGVHMADSLDLPSPVPMPQIGQ